MPSAAPLPTSSVCSYVSIDLTRLGYLCVIINGATVPWRHPVKSTKAMQICQGRVVRNSLYFSRIWLQAVKIHDLSQILYLDTTKNWFRPIHRCYLVLTEYHDTEPMQMFQRLLLYHLNNNLNHNLNNNLNKHLNNNILCHPFMAKWFHSLTSETLRGCCLGRKAVAWIDIIRNPVSWTRYTLYYFRQALLESTLNLDLEYWYITHFSTYSRFRSYLEVDTRPFSTRSIRFQMHDYGTWPRTIWWFY